MYHTYAKFLGSFLKHSRKILALPLKLIGEMSKKSKCWNQMFRHIQNEVHSAYKILIKK